MSPPILLGLVNALPLLVKRLNATPVSYYGTYGGLGIKLKENLRLKFSLYGHIGIRKFQLFSFSKKKTHYYELARQLIIENGNLEKFERIRYRNILIGDTVYDSFIRGNNLPTLYFDHPDLLEKLANTIRYVDLLYDYYAQNRVAAVCIIETTYILAIPGRVALEFGIDVFVITHASFFRLNKQEYFGFHEFKYFKQVFESLPESIKSWGRLTAQSLLSTKLESAGFKIDSRVSFSHFPVGSVFKLQQPIRLLVSAHDFFDSPHRVGYGLFSDFYDWLTFLRSIALKTDYQWFVRPHPNSRKWNEEVLKELFDGIPTVSILSPTLPNSELTEFNFSAVLTVFGTVGAEWPLYGVPVINGSLNHKHLNIFGNITPTSKEDYVHILSNLSSLEFIESNSEHSWCEYVFMKEYFMHKSLNTRYFGDLVTSLGLDVNWVSRRGFDWGLFLQILEREQYPPEFLNSGYSKFLESRDYFINRLHFDSGYQIKDYFEFR